MNHSLRSTTYNCMFLCCPCCGNSKYQNKLKFAHTRACMHCNGHFPGNNNNNNNTNDNIYGAVIVAKATARVHPVHVMNMARRQAAADPQTRPGCESACRLPETTPTIAIYYYYSARKLILILPSHGRVNPCCPIAPPPYFFILQWSLTLLT